MTPIFRFAAREARGGIRGFRILLACLALGVAAIAGAGSLAEAVRAGIRADAKALLGGDVAVSLSQREASPEQLAWFKESGRVSHVLEMRAMAHAATSEARALVEMKGADAAYPLFGAMELAPPISLSAALEKRDGRFGAVVEEGLLHRLNADVGAIVRIGDADFEIRARILREPDRVASVFALGPRFLAHSDAFPETGLLLPGSLVRHIYRIRLNAESDASRFSDTAERRFPEAGWRVIGPDDAAPGIKRFINNITMFLTLVGLTALLIGGLGVANAIKSYLASRMTTLAILKAIGAPARTVFAIYLLLTLGMAALGIAIGLALGAAVPILGIEAIADQLPARARFALYPRPLIEAAAFGFLTTLVFALPPLAQAARISSASLLRAAIGAEPGRMGRLALFAVIGSALMLAGLTVWAAPDWFIAACFVIGAALSMGLFRLAAALMARLARKLSHRPALQTGRHPTTRLALAGLHRPGAPTVSVMLSLGIGLSVLVALASIEANLREDLERRIPDEAPAFYFIDIQPEQAEAFDQLARNTPGTLAIERAAMVRGRIVKLAGRPVELSKIAPGVHWAVTGDRGLTSAAHAPRDARITEGTWWPEDYKDAALVSLDAAVARGTGLNVGDNITVNVLGREIEARIANLREIDWSTLSMNFTLIFSPGILEAAPHSYIAMLRAIPERENAIERVLTNRFANVSAVRVKEAVESVRAMLEQAGLAVRLVAAVAVLAGALVLAGTIVAQQQRRVREAVALKVLGATRKDVLRVHLLEYALLGGVTAALAACVGNLASWAVLTLLMKMDWSLQIGATGTTVGLCLGAALLAGLAGAYRALSARPLPLLRND